MKVGLADRRGLPGMDNKFHGGMSLVHMLVSSMYDGVNALVEKGYKATRIWKLVGLLAHGHHLISRGEATSHDRWVDLLQESYKFTELASAHPLAIANCNQGKILRARLKALLRKTARLDEENNKRGWEKWVANAFKPGASGAHAFTRGENATNVVPTEQLNLNLEKILRREEDHWSDIWKCTDSERSAGADVAVKAYLDEIVSVGPVDQSWRQKFTPSAIRAVARSFSAKTSIGSDHLSFLEIAALPDSIL